MNATDNIHVGDQLRARGFRTLDCHHPWYLTPHAGNTYGEGTTRSVVYITDYEDELDGPFEWWWAGRRTVHRRHASDGVIGVEILSHGSGRP